MQVDVVYADRLLIHKLEAYKSNRNSALEVIQYTGALMVGEVAFAGKDCRHTTPGEKVLLQFPVGMEINFEGKKFLIIREMDILFSLAPDEQDAVAPAETEKIIP